MFWQLSKQIDASVQQLATLVSWYVVDHADSAVSITGNMAENWTTYLPTTGHIKNISITVAWFKSEHCLVYGLTA
jgi:hypothetical protein